jgi:hypothetical protein
MAAIMYLRCEHRQGIRILHIDDLNVDADYRGHGLAQRLLQLADELAHDERRPFLKLAVTVANTPAVTLYRRLGYQEQHHRYFTYEPSTAALRTAITTDVILRRLQPRRAWEEYQRFCQMELQVSVPAVAELMTVYYPRGTGGVGMPKVGAHCYTIEHGGESLGYGDAFRQGPQWHVRLSLRPDMWSTETERQAIQQLASAVTGAHGPYNPATFELHVPSAAHFDALCAGQPSLASQLGLAERNCERMIMAKVVAGVS